MGVAQATTRFVAGDHADLVKLTGGLGDGTDDGSVLVSTHTGAGAGRDEDRASHPVDSSSASLNAC